MDKFSKSIKQTSVEDRIRKSLKAFFPKLITVPMEKEKEPPAPPPPRAAVAELAEDLASKQKRIKMYKPIWRFLLISNLALGAYMFAKPRKKSSDTEPKKRAKKGVKNDKAPVEAVMEPAATTTPERPLPLVAPRAKKPILEHQQRELFNWILEEKRKVTPSDPEEKKRVDEEKAILKHFIRTKSIPNL